MLRRRLDRPDLLVPLARLAPLVLLAPPANVAPRARAASLASEARRAPVDHRAYPAPWDHLGSLLRPIRPLTPPPRVEAVAAARTADADVAMALSCL